MKHLISAEPCWSSCLGRTPIEVQRFEARAAQVRDIGVRRAVTGSVFFAH